MHIYAYMHAASWEEYKTCLSCLVRQALRIYFILLSQWKISPQQWGADLIMTGAQKAYETARVDKTSWDHVKVHRHNSYLQVYSPFLSHFDLVPETRGHPGMVMLGNLPSSASRVSVMGSRMSGFRLLSLTARWKQKSSFALRRLKACLMKTWEC